MAEVDKRQELSLREVELIRELAQIRKEKSEELEWITGAICGFAANSSSIDWLQQMIFLLMNFTE